MCHCEERFSRRSNLQTANWGSLRCARNDKAARTCHCEERFSRRSNLQTANWGLLRCARNDKAARTCHCEERFLRRSNLQTANWGLLRYARNDKAARMCHCEERFFATKQSPNRELGIASHKTLAMTIRLYNNSNCAFSSPIGGTSPTISAISLRSTFSCASNFSTNGTRTKFQPAS